MQTLILEPHGPVLLIRLNRPEALNALNQQMMAELTQVLTQADARKLGFDPAGLLYMGQAFTANGPVRTARVELGDVQFGPFRNVSLGASVNEGDMDGSLLGMSYLSQFQITISGDQMVLRR